jgi:hypothetical protein
MAGGKTRRSGAVRAAAVRGNCRGLPVAYRPGPVQGRVEAGLGGGRRRPDRADGGDQVLADEGHLQDGDPL